MRQTHLVAVPPALPVVIFWWFIVLFPVLLAADHVVQDTARRQPGAEIRSLRRLSADGEHWQYLFDEQGDKTLRHFRNSLIAAAAARILAVIDRRDGGLRPVALPLPLDATRLAQ